MTNPTDTELADLIVEVLTGNKRRFTYKDDTWQAYKISEDSPPEPSAKFVRDSRVSAALRDECLKRGCEIVLVGSVVSVWTNPATLCKNEDENTDRAICLATTRALKDE